mmetsp:Transcript_26764/g.47398  ORF Transcript_26764/g.47398 Transcript_26764/m.47398 type:complete len:126 (-) Transcript_26764:209-586(-)
MANGWTLLSSVAACVVSIWVAQAFLLRILEVVVLATSVMYHGFDRKQNSRIHKLDMLAVGLAIVIHLLLAPFHFLDDLLLYYAVAIAFFWHSHKFGGVWHLTACGHAMGAYAHYQLSAAMQASAA